MEKVVELVTMVSFFIIYLVGLLTMTKYILRVLGFIK